MQVGGCVNEAWDVVYGAAMQDPGWQDLLAEVDALYDRADESADVRDATQRWSRCMAERGHLALAGPDEAEASVRALRDAAQRVGDDGLVEVDVPRLAELREVETTLAVADLDCQEEVDLMGVRAAVLRDLEGEFVDQHRAELEAWALAAQKRAQVDD